MSLSFQPLGWIYHDGWSFKESYGSKTVTFYQKGHCHLFIPGFNSDEQASSLAYSGVQSYQFNVVDEWGPNAQGNVNQSIRLLGKPLWYFYIQEYWRRMYVQPWDKIDIGCTLPLNQDIQYNKYNKNQYVQKLINDIQLFIEKIKTVNFHFKDVNWCPKNYLNDYRFGKQTHYNVQYFGELFTIYRRAEARAEWFKENKQRIKPYLLADKEWTWQENQENYNDFYNNIYNRDEDLVNFIIKERGDQNNKWDYKNDFETFYINKSQSYKGWVIRKDVYMPYLERINGALNFHEEFPNESLYKEISVFCSGNYKTDIYENIYIRSGKKTGHVGIKYDASKQEHSLGPFRQGGDFYFFNTVVNRTMPCEYWLDEEKNSRQYYLKQKSSDEIIVDEITNKQVETSGGGIWKRAGNNGHFLWVENKFNETDNRIPQDNQGTVFKITKGQAGWGNYYENDSYWIAYVGEQENHRRKDIGHPASIVLQNSKRLRTDRYYQLENRKWIGRNDKVILNSQGDQELHWEESENGWSGWYEYGQIVQCVKDNNWYKRVWKPDNYIIDDPYQGQYPVKDDSPFNINGSKIEQDNNWPHWSRIKRQSFPNPPPWLNSQDYILNKNYSKIINDKFIEDIIKYDDYNEVTLWIKSPVFNDSDDNKTHLLHWQYCHYYNLFRIIRPGDGALVNYSELWQYKKGGIIQYFERDITDEAWWDEMDAAYQNDHQGEWWDWIQDKTPYRNKFQKYIDYTSTKIYLHWENVILNFVKENEAFPDIDEEDYLFEQFINNLPTDKITISSSWAGEDYGGVGMEKVVPLSPQAYKDEYYYYTITDGNTIKKLTNEDLLKSNKSKIDKETVYKYIRIYCGNDLIQDVNQLPDSIINYLRDDTQSLNHFPQIVALKNSYQASTVIELLNKIQMSIITKQIKSYYHVNEQTISYLIESESNLSEQQLSYISFNDFCNIWRPLTDDEKKNLDLQDDLPARNDMPFPPVPQSYGEGDNKLMLKKMINYIYINGAEEVFNRIKDLDVSSSSEQTTDQEEILSRIKEIVITTFNDTWNKNENNDYTEYVGYTGEGSLYLDGQQKAKWQIIIEAIANSLDEKPYSSLWMPFFPRKDDKIRDINYGRQQAGGALFSVSKLDENEYGKINEKNYKQPLDPYRGNVNPIATWLKYFNKRQIYTIPQGKEAREEAGADHHFIPIHPRANSYTEQDGARRLYCDDKFISPIIQYQKIVRLNWDRLPKFQQEEKIYKFEPSFKHVEEKTVNAKWRTEKVCTWGDGFNVEVSIPFQINGEIQSPFSGQDHKTLPIGQYANNCVLPENMMRYHIQFYDSFQQIRKYDFINYIKLMHVFQQFFIIQEQEESSSSSSEEDIWAHYNKSLYKENFNDFDYTDKYQELNLMDALKNDILEEEYNSASIDTLDEDIEAIIEQKASRYLNIIYEIAKDRIFSPGEKINKDYLTWKVLIDRYWKTVNEEYNIQDNPIVKNHNCYGNEVVENAFQTVDGKKFWREQSTSLLPTIDKVAYIKEGDKIIVGYKNSRGEIVKGGNVVQFNNPTSKRDGKWVQQCLGAVVKAKCVLVMQDALGYRFQQIVQETAIMPEDTIKGSDYKE